MKLASIVVPVYNEELAIGEVLDDLIGAMEQSAYAYEILVIDDGSTDRTAEIARARPQVRLIQHKRNRGVGIARNTGVREAQGDVVVMTDGDATYPVKDIPRLLEEMEKNDYDMIVGARKRETANLRWLRTPTKTLIRWLACYLTGTRIPDLNSGMRAMRKELVPRYFHILPPGQSWVSTITIAFLSDGFSVGYLPIDYYVRKGRSKFHPIRDTYNFLVAVIRTIAYFNPLKVFLPLSLILVSGGVFKTIWDLLINHRFRDSDVVLITVGCLVAVLGLLADLIVLQGKKD
jgi:polyisoprenyl-phosphate glycosyltransferase